MENLQGDQLLVSIFAQYSGSSFKISSESDIIQAFYKANNSGKYNILFENCTFDNDGILIRSKSLEDGLDALQQTRLLGRQNPDLKEYKIKDSVKIRYNKFIKNKLSPQIKELIGQLARDINSELKFAY